MAITGPKPNLQFLVVNMILIFFYETFFHLFVLLCFMCMSHIVCRICDIFGRVMNPSKLTIKGIKKGNVEIITIWQIIGIYLFSISLLFL